MPPKGDRLFWNENRTGRLLGIYQQLLQGEAVLLDDSREQIELLLSGLVVRQGNHLAIKNLIYQQVFSLEWVNQQLSRLRPYADAINGWITSGRSDSQLLRGQTLLAAQQWAQDKSLSDLDYQFLAASHDAERQSIQQHGSFGNWQKQPSSRWCGLWNLMARCPIPTSGGVSFLGDRSLR